MRVLGHAYLLQDNPVLRRNIEVRNPYVDPLYLLQAELLRRSRASEDPEVVEALLNHQRHSRGAAKYRVVSPAQPASM